MRRIALSALISLRQARSLSILQRGAHHAVVRGVLERSDVDAIRRQAGQAVAVSTDGRASHVNCFDLHELPDVLKRLQEAIGVVTEDREWPPLAEDFQMCDAQHCVYSTGGHFDWHLDDESDGAQGFRRLSAVVLMSDSGEFEGGAFCVDRSEASALPLANCGDAVIFQGEHLWHRVGAVTAGRRETLVLGTFDRTRGASTASTGAPKRSGTALFATTGSSEETMRVPVVSKIRGLLPAVERELSAYALPPVELVESSGDDAAWRAFYQIGSAASPRAGRWRMPRSDTHLTRRRFPAVVLPPLPPRLERAGWSRPLLSLLPFVVVYKRSAAVWTSAFLHLHPYVKARGTRGTGRASVRYVIST